MTDAIEWQESSGCVAYEAAVAAMEARVAAIREGHAPELVWLLQHPPLYTAGTSADPKELLDPGGLPVHRSGRGGRYTYHGPGQRIAYVLLDLDHRGRDVRCHVHHLEEWAILALRQFGLSGERRAGRIGVWIASPGGREAKIVAIGVRVRRWVSYHGLALNVDPDLRHFGGIVPCGIDPDESGHGVTSLAALGIAAPMAAVDAALRASFAQAFGRCADDMPSMLGPCEADSREVGLPSPFPSPTRRAPVLSRKAGEGAEQGEAGEGARAPMARDGRERRRPRSPACRGERRR